MNFSNCISLIFQKRTFLIIIWRIKCWIVPGRFNSVSCQNKMLKDENSCNYNINCDPNRRSILSEPIGIVKNKIPQPSQCYKNTNNVSFSCPLSTLSSHKVLSYKNISKLISLKLEPRHVVNDRVDYTTCANSVYYHCYNKPNSRHEHNNSNVFKNDKGYDKDR